MRDTALPRFAVLYSQSPMSTSGQDSTKVEITVAPRQARDAIANMFQLYTYDFTELWAGEDRGELDERGLFESYRYLDDYWREADRIPLLIRAGGHLAGFALVNRFSHSARTLDRNMAEFFVVRKHRRSGTGTIAARAIFSRYPGIWEAAVMRKNVGALAFWRNAVKGHPAVSDIEEKDFRTEEWNGPILRFRIDGP